MDTITANDLQVLTALLRTNSKSEATFACLAALQSGEVVLQEGSGVPVLLADILNIYRRRAEWNAERGGAILGFSELLSRLEQMPDGVVCIHCLGFSDMRFLVFTNSDSTQLAGVLQIPMPQETQGVLQQPALAAAQK